jgi:hypothetical protein
LSFLLKRLDQGEDSLIECRRIATHADVAPGTQQLRLRKHDVELRSVDAEDFADACAEGLRVDPGLSAVGWQWQ